MGSHPMTNVLIREEMWTQRHTTGRMPSGEEGRDWHNVSTNKGMPTNCQETTGRGLEQIISHSLQTEPRLPRLDLDLQP